MKQRKKLLIISVLVGVIGILFIGFRIHENHQNRVRWQGYLDEITIDNWHAGDTPYDQFLNMDFLVDFMTSRPTRSEILEMELTFPDEEGVALIADYPRRGSAIDSEHAIIFYFHHNIDDQILTGIWLYFPSHFDGLAVHELIDYELEDIAGIFNVHYGVTSESRWSDSSDEIAVITFNYREVDFLLEICTRFNSVLIIARGDRE